MPAQAGIHGQALRSILGPRLRGDDDARAVMPAQAGIHGQALRSILGPRLRGRTSVVRRCTLRRMRERQPAVYLLASKPQGTLYVGVTSALVQRAWQHRTHAVAGFTACHQVDRLVWYELHGTMEVAISREKQLKRWNRAWKIRLIEERNPRWRDLWGEILGGTPAE